jgi:hypothetical protein
MCHTHISRPSFISLSLSLLQQIGWWFKDEPLHVSDDIPMTNTSSMKSIDTIPSPPTSASSSPQPPSSSSTPTAPTTPAGEVAVANNEAASMTELTTVPTTNDINSNSNGNGPSDE